MRYNCVMTGSGIPAQAERRKERQFLRKGWAKANGSSILPYAASLVGPSYHPWESPVRIGTTSRRSKVKIYGEYM